MDLLGIALVSILATLNIGHEFFYVPAGLRLAKLVFVFDWVVLFYLVDFADVLFYVPIKRGVF